MTSRINKSAELGVGDGPEGDRLRASLSNRVERLTQLRNHPDAQRDPYLIDQIDQLQESVDAIRRRLFGWSVDDPGLEMLAFLLEREGRAA